MYTDIDDLQRNDAADKGIEKGLFAGVLKCQDK